MKLYFLTGNKNKVSEIKKYVPELEQLDIDLPEEQDIDAHKVIKTKLLEATKHHDGEFIVEDTSLYFDGMNGLPGTLIKWFIKTIGNEGLVKLAKAFDIKKAEAKTIIGYINEKKEIYFFEGIVEGKIVDARGNDGWGWDPIFMPKGYDKTFAELGKEEKSKLSMRAMAAQKLQEFLNQN